MGPSSSESRKCCKPGVDLPARAPQPSGGLLRRSLWAALVQLRSGWRGCDDGPGISGLFSGRGRANRSQARSSGQSEPRVRSLWRVCVHEHRVRGVGNIVSRVDRRSHPSPSPPPHRTSAAAPPPPLSSKPFGRREVALLALCVLGLGCSERLTPSRAATIIRHSKAFLSGPPESHPVFDGVSALLAGTEGGAAEREEGDSYIAVFTYHWPDPESGGSGRFAPELTAKVVLRRLGNSWAVDDNHSRALDPSWPRLPKPLSPFRPSARRAGASPVS
jgi:hypothetical protein